MRSCRIACAALVGRCMRQTTKALAKICAFKPGYQSQEEGSSTIEFVLWLPILAGFVMLATDATLLMHEQTYLTELSRDAARMVAVGEKTEEEAEEATLARFNDASAYNVDVEIDGEFVQAVVTIPFKNVILFSGPFSGDAILTGHVSMWIEDSAEAGS